MSLSTVEQLSHKSQNMMLPGLTDNFNVGFFEDGFLLFDGSFDFSRRLNSLDKFRTRSLDSVLPSLDLA